MKAILLCAAFGICIATATAFAGSLTWPFGSVGTFGADTLDQSKTLTLIVVDPTATAPGSGVTIRAPLTGW